MKTLGLDLPMWLSNGDFVFFHHLSHFARSSYVGAGFALLTAAFRQFWHDWPFGCSLLRWNGL